MKHAQAGLGVIITRDDKVLLMKRINAHGAGTWSPPGGHIDYGESLEECACREVAEEVGIEVSDIQFRGITNDIFSEEGKHYVTVWMHATAHSGEPVVASPREATEVKWFKWSELPDALFLPLQNLLDDRCYLTKQDFVK